jgi:cytochrome c biogenesis protein CcdA
MMKKIKFCKIIGLVLIMLSLFLPFASHAQPDKTGSNIATIYYNEACGMCAKYAGGELQEMLKQQGISEIIKKDYVNIRNYRKEMNQMMTQLGVPLELQSHMTTFIKVERLTNTKYLILGGHVPEHIIKDLFNPKNLEKFKRIIVYQDKMHGDIEDYRVWAIPEYADGYVGEIKTYPINTKITEYLNYLEDNKTQLKLSAKADKNKSLLPVVLVSGFLDGINPCAFAVLLLFIAFLFSIQRGKKDVWKMGAVYISAIYLAYLLIGFGILKAVMFSNSPHFMAKLGAWLVIILGVINIINHYYKKFPIKLRIPHASKETLQKWMHKATLPAAFVMGFLVGLCTFPCSGGIYVAIIGLLVAKTTYWSGVNYLLLYNVMFVLPLVIILILTANPYAVVNFGQWQQRHKKMEKFVLGLVMIGLGAVILIFFV